MLNEPTLDKLKALKLDALAHAWLEQQKNPEIVALSFDERFAMVVDAEWLHRENRRLERTLKEAKLRLSNACVEERLRSLQFSAARTSIPSALAR